MQYQIYQPTKEQLFSDGALSLMQQHWEEVGANQDHLELDLDIDAYKKMMDAGVMQTYYVTTKADDELVGYWSFFLIDSPHHAGKKCAQNDVVYVKKSHRAYPMVQQCFKGIEANLKRKGASIIHYSVTTKRDFSPLLKRQGFEKIEDVYSKYLGE